MSIYRNKILELKDISKSYGSKSVLEDIDIHLCDGEITSLLGKSGSGKTTLFNIAAGLLVPDSGKVYLRGKDVTGHRGQVGYMLQKDLLLDHMTILENIALPRVIFESKAQGFFYESKIWKQAKEEVLGHLGQFGLEGTEGLYPSQLSGGMRQRAALLRTYLSGKDVFLLDEPFSALDQITKADLHEWYMKISQSLGLSTLFVTHDIEEAIYLSNRIYVLGEDGQIKAVMNIKEEFPRNHSFRLSQSFFKYKKQLVSLIV